MVTIKDIAKKAGVSVGTVSNVLNNVETVRKDITEKVQKTIRELGYKPSRIASGLSRKVTKNIGLVIPDVASPFYSDLIKGITNKLTEYNYEVFLCNSNNDAEKEKNIISNLESLWVDGIIIVPVYSKYRNNDFLNNPDTQIVILNRDLEDINKDIILFNNYDGAYKATKLLIENKHNNIICLTGPKISQSASNRFAGWKKAMEEINNFKKAYSFWGKFTVESGYEMMKDAFGKIDSIDAVFAASDFLALGAIKAIKEKSLLIPQDISIIGFGDIYLCKYLDPSLTTINRPFRLIGEKSVEILLQRINGKKSEYKKIIIDGEIVNRSTVFKNTNG